MNHATAIALGASALSLLVFGLCLFVAISSSKKKAAARAAAGESLTPSAQD